MSDESEWKIVCSDAFLKGQKLAQIPFYKNGTFICKACKENCRADESGFKESDTYFLEFQCQCQFLPDGECFFAERIMEEEGGEEDVKLKQELIKYMDAEIDKKVNVPIPPNPVEEKRFLDTIDANYNKVQAYEDELTKSMGLSIIPEEIQAITDQVSQLKALLKWFKEEFFTWCDKPKCDKCHTNANVVSTGMAQPTYEEKNEGGASRVEAYVCNQCKTQLRFPRYNNVVKLFETRTGRCGEWANCFTALCVALGHETRYVHDWTDHVWTECFIDSTQTWTHLDSCENAFNTPLIYEGGWGKKLTYVMAFSKDEIVDVTNRYILSRLMSKMRRKLIPEEWLKKTLEIKNSQILRFQPNDRQEIIRKRWLAEQEHLRFDHKHLSNDENIPRQSGSLEWRSQRGELGSKTVDNQTCVTDPIAKSEEKKETAQQQKQSTLQQQQVSKEKAKEEIMLLFKQMTEGCGNPECQNKESCGSANSELKSMTKEVAFKEAMKKFVTQNFKKCQK